MNYRTFLPVLAVSLIAFPPSAHAGTETRLAGGGGTKWVTSAISDGTGGEYVGYSQGDGTADAYVLRMGGTTSWPSPVHIALGAGVRVVSLATQGVMVFYTTLGDTLGNNLNVQRIAASGASAFPAPKKLFQARAIRDIVGLGDGAVILSRGSDEAEKLTRIDSMGTVLWTKSVGTWTGDGSFEGNPMMCQTPTGDSVVVRPGAQILMQKYDPNGNPLWNGGADVAVTSVYGSKGYVGLACDGAGNALVSWEDRRRGATALDVFAQRIDASGHAVWAANGVEIARDVEAMNMSLAVDGSGGAYVTMIRKVTLNDTFPTVKIRRVFLVHAGPTGNLVFGSGGGMRLDPSTAFTQRAAVLAPDGKGGVFVGWQAEGTASGTPTACLGMRWLDGAGTSAWGAEPVRTGTCNAQDSAEHWVVGTGKVALVWKDPRNGYADVYSYASDAPGAVAAPLPPTPPPPPAPKASSSSTSAGPVFTPPKVPFPTPGPTLKTPTIVPPKH